MTLKTRLVGLAFAAFVVCAPASAQVAQPDSAQVGLARDMLTTMKAADNIEAVIPTVMNALKPVVTKGDPKIAKDWDEIAPLMQKEMGSVKTQMVEEIALVYARAFTADELKQFVAFYKTPAGAKLAAQTPALAQQTMAVGQRFGQQVAGRIAERMKEELRKRGNNI